MPSARCALSCRRAATAVHSDAARAVLMTRRVSARGLQSGCRPSGVVRLGAERSKSAPRPSTWGD
eukprot:2627336-Lingulodinium_polyedra.AAC.1